MLSNFFRALNHLFNAFFEKLSDPDDAFELNYYRILDCLKEVRTELRKLTEHAQILQKEIDKANNSLERQEKLKSELQLTQERIEVLQKRLAELDEEHRKTFTKAPLLMLKQRSNHRYGLSNPAERDVGTLMISRQFTLFPKILVSLLLLITLFLLLLFFRS
jgi:predicted nuclease with TOPRIM domain